MKIVYFPEPKLRFYCQDKNASTTLLEYLPTVFGEPIIYWDISNINYNEYFNASRSETADPPALQEFTVIRNTYDRLASTYRMLVKQLAEEGKIHDWFSRYNGPIMAALQDPDPFTAFVRFATSLDDVNVDTHWQCQHHHLPFHSPNFHVIRLERLAKDLSRAGGLLATIDLAKAGHQNDTASTGPSYRKLFTQEAKSLVERRYWKEIEIFGFTF